ncbi:type II toxin-antitoxin system HipA family toxin [Cysteiniphilum sp. QT6929]|uniref:type II toxin-antitoxin system HipA family toxin n=1 Tax=Cysteiniphilum sp. QT6929 TaxID=2975055 RepID=UPI0024B3B31B|nr:type II toxin-antitoxin system HipA family toxin [Cysteiniphilum sp. QT6929]WHN65550.1 type II toxin-antitoxin system HipA family toxin [Cysteiniphilum sp. QT6929]
MAVETLTVYFNSICIGTISLSDGKLSFSYLPAYTSDNNNPPLSMSLPLQNEAFGHELTLAYFSGLLPDEPLRSRLAKHLHISPKNTFALLKAIGGECAGSVSFYPPETDSEYQYKILNDHDANDILKTLHKHPLLAGDDGIKLSQAGAQDKLVIAFANNKLAIPLENAPSSHIIKPAIHGLTDTVFNELFCMKLAKSCGLNVANADILWLENTPYYIVERYDRVIVKGQIQRLHQEDFCQALHIPPEIKYENEGGPSLIDCFKLLDIQIKKGKMRTQDKIELFKTVVFNFLIGNGDAHGKNFSILYHQSGMILAPRYDLLSTTIYDKSLKVKMAMKIASKYKFQEVYLRHFLQLAEAIGFKQVFTLSNILEPMLNTIVDKAIVLADKLNDDKHYQSNVYQDIIATIQKHQQRLLKLSQS